MKIKFGDFEYTECWDGVLYKKLSEYPNITGWEMQTILDFVAYEKDNGRECEFEGEEIILSKIEAALNKKNNKRVAVPNKITECTACPKYKGCMTDLVCHTSPIESAIEIIKCGALLSPVKARNESAEILQKESRNAAKDPLDYFDYIMFAWGNCQAGDRLVMERKLGRFPDEDDLSKGFAPGVRFFFDYSKLCEHPNAVFEGVLPLKIKDEVLLKDWILAIIIPQANKRLFDGIIPEELLNKVHYVENDCRDIWEWSEKVYELAKK